MRKIRQGRVCADVNLGPLLIFERNACCRPGLERAIAGVMPIWRGANLRQTILHRSRQPSRFMRLPGAKGLRAADFRGAILGKESSSRLDFAAVEAISTKGPLRRRRPRF